MQHIENKDDKQAAEFREKLKNLKNYTDFEYLTWIEWKEGFARLIENKIRPQLGINENHYGEAKPYNRVIFYCGGSKFIQYLIKKEPNLYVNIESLFNKMFNY